MSSLDRRSDRYLHTWDCGGPIFEKRKVPYFRKRGVDDIMPK